MTAGAYSIPEVQRLVATLVASKPGGRIAELGTSYGDGARAIAAALPPGATFVTAEIDPERAARARAALAGAPAEVLEGDWIPRRLVILEFPSVERVKEWLGSAEYSAIKPIRHRHATSHMVVIEGLA